MTAAMVKEHQYDRILWLLGDVDILYYNAVGGGEGFYEMLRIVTRVQDICRNITHLSIFYGAIYWKEKQQE